MDTSSLLTADSPLAIRQLAGSVALHDNSAPQKATLLTPVTFTAPLGKSGQNDKQPNATICASSLMKFPFQPSSAATQAQFTSYPFTSVASSAPVKSFHPTTNHIFQLSPLRQSSNNPSFGGAAALPVNASPQQANLDIFQLINQDSKTLAVDSNSPLPTSQPSMVSPNTVAAHRGLPPPPPYVAPTSAAGDLSQLMAPAVTAPSIVARHSDSKSSLAAAMSVVVSTSTLTTPSFSLSSKSVSALPLPTVSLSSPAFALSAPALGLQKGAYLPVPPYSMGGHSVSQTPALPRVSATPAKLLTPSQAPAAPPATVPPTSSVPHCSLHKLKGILTEKAAKQKLKSDLAMKFYSFYAKRKISNHAMLGPCEYYFFLELLDIVCFLYLEF